MLRQHSGRALVSKQAFMFTSQLRLKTRSTNTEQFFNAANPDKIDRNLPLETRDYIRSAIAEPNVIDERKRPINDVDAASAFLGHSARLDYQYEKRPSGAAISAVEDARPISPHAQLAIAMDNRILAIASADSMSPLERSELLVQCFAEVKEQGLSLKASSCEAMFSTWASSVAPEVTATPTAALLEDAKGRTTLPCFRYFEQMVQLHHYMKGSFTAPTPTTMEHLMRAVAAETLLRGPSERLLHLGCNIMSDHYTFLVLPTRSTYTNFFEVCGENRVMDIAVIHFADAQDKLFITPDSSMCRAIVSGLTKSGQPDDAVAFLARLRGIPLDGLFLESAINAFLLTDDPMAAFAAYRAICGPEAQIAGVVPTVGVFTLLMTACQRTDVWLETKFVLAEMQRFGVKGDEKCLNAVLKGLLLSDMHDYARLLAKAMRRRGVPIWPSMVPAVEAIGVTSTDERRVAKHLVAPGRDQNDRKEKRSALESELREAAKRGVLLKLPTAKLQSFLETTGRLSPQSTTLSGRALQLTLAKLVHAYFYGVKPRSLHFNATHQDNRKNKNRIASGGHR